MAQRIYSVVMPLDPVHGELFLDLPDDRRVVNVERQSDGALVRVWIEQTVKV